MENINFEINDHIKELAAKLAKENPSIKEDITLLVNMAFSDGKSKGEKSANITSSRLGHWSNRN